MKRNIYFTVLFSMGILLGFSQSQRMVLLEHFTQASCGPCATYNPQINNLLLANPDKITAVMYHTSWPGYDPMYNHNTTENGGRTSFYTVNSVPNSVLDGNIYNGHPNGWNINTVNNRYAVPSPCDISVFHELTDADDVFNVYVLIEATQDIPDGMKLHVATIEEYIDFASPPGSNGETDFYNVMKKMLPNHLGTTLPPMQSGEYLLYHFNWEHQNVYDINELSAIVFVQNNTSKEVAQAAPGSDTPFAAPYTTDAAVIMVDELSQTYCDGYMAPTVTVRNNGSGALTSMDISYTVNGGNPVTLNWTGNLGFLETETVALEGTTFSVMEVNTLEIVLGNPNGQDDDYATNNIMVVEIDQAPDVGDAVSLVLKLDDNPGETSWEVVDSEGNMLYEGGNYSTPGQILVEQFDLDLEDCYSFFIYDEGGDGLTKGNGSYKLGYGGNIIFAEGAAFGEMDEAQFSVGLTGVNEKPALSGLELYPVPAAEKTTLELLLAQDCDVTYRVVDPSGSQVLKADLGRLHTGTHTYSIDLSDLSAGIYFITVETGDKQTVRKIVVKQ